MAEESTHHGDGFVPRSANAVLARAARMHPDTVAVETDDDQLTYGRLHDAVLRLAGGFAARVVGPGDRLGPCLGNGTDIVVAFYAAQCLGVIVNAIGRNALGKPNRQWAVEHVASDAGVASQEVTA